MSRAGIIATISFLALAAFVVLQTLTLASATCEVCVEYRGHSQCRTVSAATENEAREGAIINACAFVSGGVTDSMACQRGQPTSERCW
jgi:hypothetical protein